MWIVESKIVGQGAFEYAVDQILQSSLHLLKGSLGHLYGTNDMDAFVLDSSRISDYTCEANYPGMVNQGLRSIPVFVRPTRGILTVMGLAELAVAFLLELNRDIAIARQAGFATARYRNLNCQVDPQGFFARLYWSVFYLN